MDSVSDWPFNPAGGIFVTVAGNNSFGISKDNRLIHFPTNGTNSEEVKDLGPATARNIESLKYALERLAIHSTD